MGRLEQVTVNLLDNAIKYTPNGGSILLKVRAEKERAILEVIDTGIGISPVALPYIFNRFFRTKEVKAARTEGSGLGLAIVRSIAEAHGGSVSVENNTPAGTIIRVELPLLPPEKKTSTSSNRQTTEVKPSTPPWQAPIYALLSLSPVSDLSHAALRQLHLPPLRQTPPPLPWSRYAGKICPKA